MHTFIMTFGFGQLLENCYAKVEAEDYLEAREIIQEEYGSCWAFLYDSPEKAGVEKYNLLEVPFGAKNGHFH